MSLTLLRWFGLNFINVLRAAFVLVGWVTFLFWKREYKMMDFNFNFCIQANFQMTFLSKQHFRFFEHSSLNESEHKKAFCFRMFTRMKWERKSWTKSNKFHEKRLFLTKFVAIIFNTEVAWPSGLRRWFKAPVSSGAWVRIPPLPQIFYCAFNKYLFIYLLDVHMCSFW